jgi:hypothetical protein
VSDLPQPLTPSDCNLRGLPFMPLMVTQILQSETFGLSTGDEFKAAFALWCSSWMEVPAASLPNDERMLEFLSRSRTWKRVRAVALRGWILCSDGRLYHPVIAANAMDAWEKRTEFRVKEDSKNTRQQRWREQCKQLAAQLRDIGVTPPKGASLEKLKTLLQENGVDVVDEKASTSVDGETSTVDAGEIGKTETVKRQLSKPLHSASTPPELTRAPDQPQDEGGKAEITPTPAALLSQVMRKHGVMSNPGDPRLIAMADQGVTVETIEAACLEARQAKPNERISPAYIAAIIERWSKEAKAIDVAGAKVPDAKANGNGQAADRWWLTDQGIVRKGKELGMYARGTESYADFKDRIFTKLREQGATA